VEFVLEKCGHTILKKCSDKEPNCTYKCIDRLECGHACEKNCHKNDDPEHEKVVFVFKNVLYHNRYNNDFDIL